MSTRGILIAVAAIVAAIGAWGSGAASGDDAGGERGPVLCLIAASTEDAMKEIAATFAADTGISVKLNADDSSKLATQIFHGAPADLFLSANDKWAEYIKEKGFARHTQPLLGNSLVLVVPRGNPGQVRQPEDLAKPAVERIAVAGPTVPAGIYARQALSRLKLWDNLWALRKVVAGDNVRDTLTYVERAEVQAGIVYATDARISNKIEVVYTFPPSSHDRLVYPLVLLKAGAGKAAARRFYEYLQTPAAEAVFRKYGFQRPAPDGGSGGAVQSTPQDGEWLTAEEWSAVCLSLLVAGTATAVSLPFGLALGYLLARRQFFGKSLVETVIHLPLVLPPVVTGYLLLVALGKQGWIGRYLDQWFGVSLVFTWEGAALASAVMAFPLMVRAIRLAFSEVDVRLEQAARTLGAGRFDTFLTVSLPLARRGIIIGGVLAFARSLGEFGATIMIAGSIPDETRTIPLYIYSLVKSPGGAERSVRLVVVSILIAVLALGVAEYLDRRGRGQRAIG
jgi:molybdate transport system permease protein